MGVRHTMQPLASALASTTTSSQGSSRGWHLQHATNDIYIAPHLADSGAHSVDGLMKVAKPPRRACSAHVGAALVPPRNLHSLHSTITMDTILGQKYL